MIHNYFKFIFFLFIFSSHIYSLNGTSFSGISGMRFPCISPNGKQISFCLYGDIWEVSAKGGRAQRLTIHQAEDLKPRWSPNGKWLAFSSLRSGNFDVWIMPSFGGKPKQITFHSSWDSICDWSSDGKWLLFASMRSGEMQLWKIPTTGGVAAQISFDNGRDGHISADGKTIVYNRGSASLWRKGYKGFGNWDIYEIPSIGGVPKKWTNYKGNDLSPMFYGKNIYFTREDSSSIYNIWRISAPGTKAKQITHLKHDIHHPYLAKNGKSMVFESQFKLWKLTLSAKSKPMPISIQIDSDNKNNEITKTITSRNEMGHWSFDGSQIAFVVDGNIWTTSAFGGEAVSLVKDQNKAQWPRFSPDGKYLAYFSNKAGNNDLYLLSLKDKKEEQITYHNANDFFHSWAPDSQSLLFTSERNGNRDIWQISIKKRTLRQITNASGSEDDAVFSPDGKWIAFDSNQSGHQEIWIMPAHGKFAQARQLTYHKRLSQVPSWSADSDMIAYETNNALGESFIWIAHVFKQEAMPLVKGYTVPVWSPDGKSILCEKTSTKNLVKIRAPKQMTTIKPIPFFIHHKTTRQKQSLKIFEEAWQTINQSFYDPDFHQVDWKKIKEKYLPLATNAKTNEELNAIINRMLGELKASHVGITGPTRKQKLRTGYLGCTLVANKKGAMVKEVIKDGPADKAWIRTGDYLLEVDDIFIGRNTNVNELLNNKAGKKIKVYVGDPENMTKGRYTTITPINFSKMQQLEYRHSLVKKIAIVRKKTHGQVVYVHIREMSQDYLQQFQKVIKIYIGHSKGMILDLRGNVGGFIHQQLLDIFIKKPFAFSQQRGGKKQPDPKIYWDKPVVVLINEKSYSDAEVFAFAFKQLKLGSLVGVPTAGEVIGTRNITLSNGAQFRVPRVGYYSLQGKNLEGMGIKPNFFVEETAKHRYDKEDIQLLKAIEVIKQNIGMK